MSVDNWNGHQRHINDIPSDFFLNLFERVLHGLVSITDVKMTCDWILYTSHGFCFILQLRYHS